MALFAVTFCIMALAVSGMAIGVIFGRSPIAGSCGGLNAVDGSGRCGACSRPCRSARRASTTGTNAPADSQAAPQDTSTPEGVSARRELRDLHPLHERRELRRR